MLTVSAFQKNAFESKYLMDIIIIFVGLILIPHFSKKKKKGQTSISFCFGRKTKDKCGMISDFAYLSILLKKPT